MDLKQLCLSLNIIMIFWQKSWAINLGYGAMVIFLINYIRSEHLIISVFNLIFDTALFCT